MLRCTECGTSHPANTLFCDECGARLRPPPERFPTPPLFRTYKASDSNVPVSASVPDNSKTGPATSPLPVTLATHDKTRAFGLDLHNTLLIGRADRSMSMAPDIDLTALNALPLGVSRRHARLIRTSDGVALEDLKSLNGTFVRGQRLAPHQPQVLTSGDELRFGQVALVISF